MSKALTKIIDENVEYIISQFIESTESSPGLSRWEEIQKYAPVKKIKKQLYYEEIKFVPYLPCSCFHFYTLN